jgi:hypothetical protein
LSHGPGAKSLCLKDLRAFLAGSFDATRGSDGSELVFQELLDFVLYGVRVPRAGSALFAE